MKTMRSVRRALCLVACMQLASSLHQPAAAQQSSVPGITYVLDTVLFTRNAIPAGEDALRAWAAFESFTARVTFAAGRGRLDVLTRRTGPVVLADSIATTTPLAVAGDYYLFDTTGFVLVRPDTKTFSSFSISDDAFNYEGKRDGWPNFFQFRTSRFDTVAAGSSDAMRHGPVHIYWHADSSLTVIARGRLTVDDAPMGEMTIAQWFGSSRALAQLSKSGRAFPKVGVTLTTAVPRAAPGANGVPDTFILKQEIFQFTAANVDLARLILPAGFTEARWPGYERVANPPSRSADSGARWRKLPGERPQ